MPPYIRTLNQTREPETIDLSGLTASSGSGWITTTPTTPTQATSTWVYTPSVTTSSSATRVYIDPPSQYMDDSDWTDWTREFATNFYRSKKKTQEKPRELTDEELVEVLNS